MTTLDLTTPHDRALEQRRRAIKRANVVRSRRAVLRRDLKAGRACLTPLLADPPAWLTTAKVFDVLLILPKYGRVKVAKTLKRAGVSPGARCGGLTERQRAALLAALGGL